MKVITRLLNLFLLIIALILNSFYANSQIFINEFMASNTGSIVDPDYKESADWVELYNAGQTHINIGGFYITDNFSDPQKWQIPVGTQIAGNGFLLIWTDGLNTGLHTSFKLAAEGEELALFNASGILVDSLRFGQQEANVSMGRTTDGGNLWGFFTSSTPGSKNNTEVFNGIVHQKPQFSILGGIFTSAQTLSITNTMGGAIHYTTDGSEPQLFSPIVNHPLQIHETTVIRARIFEPNKVPGKVITQSYFIAQNNPFPELPVVAISTDPANFWDAEKGIYVQNFKPSWEIPINIELFENDGSDRAGFNLEAGAKINGLFSWQLPQKMLGIYFRKSYGEGKLDYPLLFDRDRKSFDSFALRASGSDWAYSLFRDGMTQSLTRENMDVDFQGHRACVVYVNGIYLGIHNIRSKIDEDFILQNHQLGDQKIDMIENENYVETGSLDQYAEFEALYKNDLSVQANFDAVAAQMDIENFTDFIITEIYSQNTSVDHNIMAWKPQNGGKWKWILNDLDRGFFKPGSNLIGFYSGRKVIPFSQLLTNENYRKYFGKRLADHLFTTFDPVRVKLVIEQFQKQIETEIPRHIQRWQGTSSSYGNPISSVDYWNREVGKMKLFAENRPAALLNDLQNYGFEKSEALALSIYPENAGTIDFNGITIKQMHSQGNYPLNEEILLQAEAKAGYSFKGWGRIKGISIIAKEEAWKYDDSGNVPDENWMQADFDDSNWKVGQAELGYGDGDEKTEINFGNDSSNKFISAYFRKSFSIENLKNIKDPKINLKCDDGAIVYLNGVEVLRLNMPDGDIHGQTLAENSVSGSAEDNFTVFTLDTASLLPGLNTIAVEVHQVSGTSSDISFDLEMTAFAASKNELIDKNTQLRFEHKQGGSYVAFFENDGSCVLPQKITREMFLDKQCSPYRVPNDVLVSPEGKLTVGPGVELWFSDDVSLEINGSLRVLGTTDDPVIFRSNPKSKNKKWGIINFVNADTSCLNNVIIEDASKGFHPQREIGAVSVFNSVLKIDDARIENVHENPIVARYSNVSLVNSKLHSVVTGDLINIKYGLAYIDSCTFTGNSMPDTDAIDYDDVTNGVIRNSVISGFYGFNSDAIDIGEKAKNISIENVVVYNITDKGVSVGQQSSATITNSIFVNCNLGVALKDSSRATINHCTFYGNGIPVSCYEKNTGDAGGNGVVTNSILSNSYETSYFNDGKSTLKISFSASDNNIIAPAENNLFVNPEFKNPNLFDFSLEQSSPLLEAANSKNIGANLNPYQKFNQLFISSIAYKSNLISDVNEFLELTNPGNTAMDLSGFEFTKGITFRFPEGATLSPGDKIFITNNITSDFWKDSALPVYQWDSGRLADEGETIQLETPAGIIIDQVKYNSDANWPNISSGQAISLRADNLDNHFGSNWKMRDIMALLDANQTLSADLDIKVYPNPTKGIVFVSGKDQVETILQVFNLSGNLVKTQKINSNPAQINLSGLMEGVYILRCGNYTQRLVLLK